MRLRSVLQFPAVFFVICWDITYIEHVTTLNIHLNGFKQKSYTEKPYKIYSISSTPNVHFCSFPDNLAPTLVLGNHRSAAVQ